MINLNQKHSFIDSALQHHLSPVILGLSLELYAVFITRVVCSLLYTPHLRLFPFVEKFFTLECRFLALQYTVIISTSNSENNYDGFLSKKVLDYTSAQISIIVTEL